MEIGTRGLVAAQQKSVLKMVKRRQWRVPVGTSGRERKAAVGLPHETDADAGCALILPGKLGKENLIAVISPSLKFYICISHR